MGASPVPLAWPVAQLDVWLDWSYNGRWHHLFGQLTYRGQPVHGYSTTPSGDPLDRYGRVLYLDTFDSAWRARLAARERIRLAESRTAPSVTASSRTKPPPASCDHRGTGAATDSQ